jgi:hypothetical protein
MRAVLNCRHAPVAQLDRVPPSEGGSRTFESCRARQHFCATEQANCLACVPIRKTSAMPKAAVSGSRDVTERVGRAKFTDTRGARFARNPIQRIPALTAANEAVHSPNSRLRCVGRAKFTDTRGARFARNPMQRTPALTAANRLRSPRPTCDRPRAGPISASGAPAPHTPAPNA